MPINFWLRPLCPPGNEPYGRVRWQGPSSYTQVTVASSVPSGGDPITARTLGVNVLELVTPTPSYSGNFNILAIRLSDSKWLLMWIALVTATVGGQVQTAGAQAVAATNLSGEYCKLELTTLSG